MADRERAQIQARSETVEPLCCRCDPGSRRGEPDRECDGWAQVRPSYCFMSAGFELRITGTYFEINDLWTLDGSPKSNVGRWANHSCKPNAATEVTQRKRVWLYAMKRIRSGEEIV
jgi:hypothetical protein